MGTEPYEIIKTLEQGRFTRLCRIIPAGSLEARLEKSGPVRFYWRGAVGSKTVRVPIGLYDRRASPKSVKPTATGYSIAAAKQAAIALATRHVETRDAGGLPAVRAAQKERARKEQEAREEAAKYTLAALLDAYCDRLEALGRASHRDARSIFTHHVKTPFPKIAGIPAAKVTSEQVADMMRRLVELGKARTANKLRSYLRAAYQTAKDAKLDASIPLQFKGFGVTINPAADTVPNARGNRADRNPLMQDELLTYWQAIKGMGGMRGALLRLHLLTGGQRIAQLVRLKLEDISADTITIYDGKGRPGTEPRPHIVPLIPAARAALDELLPTDDGERGEYALSTDRGFTHVDASTLNEWAKEAVGEALPGFTAKRIRSGVETLLSRHGISKEIRGRLQSHGISGVQDRHYDGHDYLPEKQRALMTLYRVLEAKQADVTPIRSTAA